MCGRLAKFAGSSSISSADFYGRDEGISRDTGGSGDSSDLAVNIAATAKEVSSSDLTVCVCVCVYVNLTFTIAGSGKVDQDCDGGYSKYRCAGFGLLHVHAGPQRQVWL